jgi:hypothetical protein
MANVSVLYVEIPVDLKKWLYAKARSEDRTVTAVLRRILKDQQQRDRKRAVPRKEAS